MKSQSHFFETDDKTAFYLGFYDSEFCPAEYTPNSYGMIKGLQRVLKILNSYDELKDIPYVYRALRKRKIIELRDRQVTYRKIAAEMDMPVSQVHGIFKKA